VLSAIVLTSILGAPLVIQEAQCPRLLADGSVLDCEEERNVRMEFLMVAQSESARCAEDSRNCGQDFIVRCDDYWSAQHVTEFAFVVYRPKTQQERLTTDKLPGPGQVSDLRVRRDFHCDAYPYENGGSSLDCDDWNCLPECCRAFS